MHNGTIEINGADLSRAGKPKLTIRRTPDPAPPAVATRMLVTLAVSVDLEALDPSTILARAEWLAACMAAPEVLLKAGGGSGLALQWLAVPGDSNLTEALAGRTNTVELVFTASERIADAAFSGLPVNTFTPAGSATPIALHRVREESEEISTSRHSDRAAARSLTTTQLSFTARVAMANPADSFATRLAYLKAQAAIVKGLDTRQGLLALNGSSRIVRVTQFTPLIDERALTLDVKVQCTHLAMPDSGTAELVLETETATEEGSGEEVITLSGTIEADFRAIAQAKLDALRGAQQTAGRRITRFTTRDRAIDGFDVKSSDDAWPGALAFTMEARKARPNGRITLRIDTQRDFRSGLRRTYSGSATAPDAAAALTIARGSTTGETAMPTRSQETLDQASDIDTHTQLNFVKLDFSYDFEAASDGFIAGEFSTDWSLPLAGEWTATFAGHLIAPDEAAAESRLAILLTAFSTDPTLQLTKRLSAIYLDADGTGNTTRTEFARVDFSATTRKPARTYAAVEYTDTTENDYTSMTQARDLSGTLWSDSRANADTALAEFLGSLLGAVKPTRLRVAHSEMAWGPTTASAIGTGQWSKAEFSASASIPLTGATGYDLLEASYTMERTGGLNNTVITPIPFGRPVVQTATGWHPGRVAIQASAKAVNLGTAKAWVQGKRSLAPGGGHETEQPQESQSPDYTPITITAKAWTFTGRYGWTYATGLDGVW